MKRAFFALLLAAALPAAPLRAASDDEVAARRLALEVAGAFSNDGFKLRDGNWCGQLTAAKAQVIQVNLYAGNEYWFSLGATDKAQKVAVTVFDETGQPLASEPYQEGSSAAAGFAPEASGPYYIKVELLEGGPSTFCLLYSYK